MEKQYIDALQQLSTAFRFQREAVKSLGIIRPERMTTEAKNTKIHYQLKKVHVQQSAVHPFCIWAYLAPVAVELLRLRHVIVNSTCNGPLSITVASLRNGRKSSNESSYLFYHADSRVPTETINVALEKRSFSRGSRYNSWIYIWMYAT